MLKVIRERYTELIDAYELCFDTDLHGGYAFPCDANGNVAELNPYAQENYLRCLSRQVTTIRPPYVRDISRSVTHPKVCECTCGLHLDMHPDEEGLVYCPCGKCYNTAGQSIRPRSEWEERYDDNY